MADDPIGIMPIGRDQIIGALSDIIRIQSLQEFKRKSRRFQNTVPRHQSGSTVKQFLRIIRFRNTVTADKISHIIDHSIQIQYIFDNVCTFQTSIIDIISLRKRQIPLRQVTFDISKPRFI